MRETITLSLDTDSLSLAGLDQVGARGTREALSPHALPLLALLFERRAGQPVRGAMSRPSFSGPSSGAVCLGLSLYQTLSLSLSLSLSLTHSLSRARARPIYPLPARGAASRPALASESQNETLMIYKLRTRKSITQNDLE